MQLQAISFLPPNRGRLVYVTCVACHDHESSNFSSKKKRKRKTTLVNHDQVSDLIIIIRSQVGQISISRPALILQCTDIYYNSPLTTCTAYMAQGPAVRTCDQKQKKKKIENRKEKRKEKKEKRRRKKQQDLGREKGGKSPGPGRIHVFSKTSIS